MNNIDFVSLIKETLEITERELLLTDKFREYPEWDSLALLSIIALIDDEFDLLIEGEEFAKLITIQDIIEYINKSLKN